MKKIFLILGIVAIFSAQAYSQVSIKNTVGATLFFGDISDSKNISYMNSVGAGLNLLNSGALWGNVDFEQGRLVGQKEIKSKQYGFENSYKTLTINLQAFPLKFTGIESKFQPYVSVGYGQMWFRANEFDEDTGLGILCYGYQKNKSVEATKEVAVPVGIGFDYACTPLVAVTMDFSRVFVATDKLDAVVSEKKDVYGSVSLGLKYTFGKEEQTKQPVTIASEDDSEDEDEDVYEKPKKTKPAKESKATPAPVVVQQDCNEFEIQLAKKDAQIKTLQDSIFKLSNIPESLKIKYCRKYLNGLLYRQCDEEVIKSNLAILDSARINDENVDKYKYLLKNYVAWYNEFLTVVQYAQKDTRRYSPLTSESNAYKADVVSKLNNLSYNKRSVSNWQIYYLEDQINLLKRRLDEKVKHPEVIIDFSDMLR